MGAERIGAGIKQTRQPNPDTFDDLQTLGLIDVWSQPVGPDQGASGGSCAPPTGSHLTEKHITLLFSNGLIKIKKSKLNG